MQQPMTTRRALSQLCTLLVAYASSLPCLIGWIAGLMCHRVADGWKVARLTLDNLDDAAISIQDEAEQRRKAKEGGA